MAQLSIDHFHRNRDRSVGAVGDPATILLYSDTHAATVIARTDRTVTVQEDKATVVEASRANWPDVEYTYAPNPEGAIERFYWSVRGWQHRASGRRLLIGTRREYRDPCF